jgi:hypothetical protein
VDAEHAALVARSVAEVDGVGHSGPLRSLATAPARAGWAQRTVRNAPMRREPPG